MWCPYLHQESVYSRPCLKLFAFIVFGRDTFALVPQVLPQGHEERLEVYNQKVRVSFHRVCE